MEWTKVFIQTTAFGTELATGILSSSGIFGIEIVDPRERANYLEGIVRTWDYVDESLLVDADKDEVFVIFYVTKDKHGVALLKNIREKLELVRSEFGEELIGTLSVKTESTDDEDWLHEWKKHYKPIEIGKVVIVPEWEEYVGDKVIFKIDPGSAFGTGQHQTTQLCITALQNYVNDGDSIVDIGCGSGILSCVGLLLGAEFAFACDIDPVGAISATKRNAALNSIEKGLVIQAGDILSDAHLRKEIKQRKYNLVVANIVADVIIELLPLVPEMLKLNGYFISSGIIDERLEDVLNAFANNGMAVEEIISLEGWCCVVGTNSLEKECV